MVRFFKSNKLMDKIMRVFEFSASDVFCGSLLGLVVSLIIIYGISDLGFLEVMEYAEFDPEPKLLKYSGAETLESPVVVDEYKYKEKVKKTKDGAVTRGNDKLKKNKVS
jgi:hypothetical protein